MARQMSFTDTIVSELGTPREPFGLDDALVIAVLLAAVAAYFAIEWALGQLIVRLLKGVGERTQVNEKEPGSD